VIILLLVNGNSNSICREGFGRCRTWSPRPPLRAHCPLLQLVAGIICMVMIAICNMAGRCLLADERKVSLGRTAIQVAFTIFRLTETWAGSGRGWLVDRFGPKIVVFVAGSRRHRVGDELGRRHAHDALPRCGESRHRGRGVYGTCIGNALKWFPIGVGSPPGLTAAGFGAGSALTIIRFQG